MILSVGAVPACTGPEGQAAARHPQIWTLFDIEPALDSNVPLAVDPTMPGGLSPQTILVREADGTATIKINAAFAEEWAAAYIITDVWRGYDGVWAQPWYFLVTAWNEAAPMQSRLKDGNGVSVPPLFDVAPSSNFYSPFWLLEYAEVPAGSDPAHYRSTKALFDEHRILHPSNGFTYALHPDKVTLPKDPADTTKIRLTHPFLGNTFTGFSDTPTAICDGTVYPSWNLGRDTFLYDQELLVEEAPLFVFAARGPDGAPQSWGAPPVAGVAPLLSGRPAPQGTAVPRFKAYYRYTWAIVPATAAVFDPVAYPDAAALVAARMDASGNPLNPQLFNGRVAVNAFRAATATMEAQPDCFASASFPDSCQWLDSQAHVEARLGPGSLKPTAVTVAAPVIAVGAPVSPAP